MQKKEEDVGSADFKARQLIAAISWREALKIFQFSPQIPEAKSHDRRSGLSLPLIDRDFNSY